jgi:hypothetical protein
MAWRKLVDDLDLTAHEALPNAHHPQAHALDGADHTGTNVAVDTVSEKTAAAGVTVDGAKIKDGFVERSLHISDLAPVAGDDIVIHRFDVAVTVVKVIAVIKGAGTSATFNLAHGTDRSLAGTSLWTADQMESSKTTGTTYTTFDNPSVAANSFLRLKVPSLSGAIDELAVTLWVRPT